MEATAQTPPTGTEGISTAGTLRRLGETFLSILHNRLELLTLELKEEKHWLIATLMFATFGIVFGILSIVAILVTVAVLVTIAGLAVSLLGLKKKLRRPAPLVDTLSEIKKDIACLKQNEAEAA